MEKSRKTLIAAGVLVVVGIASVVAIRMLQVPADSRVEMAGTPVLASVAPSAPKVGASEVGSEIQASQQSARPMDTKQAFDIASKLPTLRTTFPQGLEALKSAPIDASAAKRAHEASRLLSRCDHVATDLERERASISKVRNVAVQIVLAKEVEDMQWLQAECASLGARVAAVRKELLEIAVRENQVGAAADLAVFGKVNAEIIEAVRRDAVKGDWQSIAIVASGGEAQGSIASDDITVARAVLVLATKEEALNSFAERYMSIAFVRMDRQGVLASADREQELKKAMRARETRREFPMPILNADQSGRVASIMEALRRSV